MKNKNKTLVAYASKGGATEESARIISEVLRDNYLLDVDVVNLRKTSPSLVVYNNVVVGAGVRVGKVYGEALNFLKQDFEDRKIAFFVCCGDAGDPEKYEESIKKYINTVLVNYPSVKPVATEAFGGRMKILGKTIFDKTDPNRIHVWADLLGNNFGKK